MSVALINRSPDLKRLRDEGFEIEVRNGLLLVSNIPYLNALGEVKRGTLVSPLKLVADQTRKPDDHVLHFIGEFPCFEGGQPIKALFNSSEQKDLGAGIVVNHTFSCAPDQPFSDFYEKIVSYVEIISAPPKVLDPSLSEKSFLSPVPQDADTVFFYTDSNSSRAGILKLAEKTKGQKIAIIGVGGTGSYVVDFVAKTEVEEIHLFDGDSFSQHNAFRAPGAPSFVTLQGFPKKTDYFASIYSANRRGVFSHPEFITTENLEQLQGMNFVFLCIDKPDLKAVLIPKLLEFGIPFIDVGMGISLRDDALVGTVTITLVTPKKHDHIDTNISMAGDAQDDYAENIQIAELNALNAALAVMKWKQFIGFYHDFRNEHTSAYMIETGYLHNDDQA